MNEPDNTWSLAHDLALIYVALAYGADNQLSDAELETITSKLQGWQGGGREDVHEVVLEAMTVFLSEHPEREVVHAVESLKRSLSEEELRRVLEEIVRIAEADGILLSNERSLISMLADVWGIKAAGQDLLARTTATVEEHPSWSLMHDIGLVFLIMAHSTDNELSKEEIDAIILRLREWQPELEEDEVRQVLREALGFYATGPDETALRRSVQAIRDALPMMQRLVLLDDLSYIAASDGTFRKEEKEMLGSFAQAWNVNLRLNGRSRAAPG